MKNLYRFIRPSSLLVTRNGVCLVFLHFSLVIHVWLTYKKALNRAGLPFMKPYPRTFHFPFSSTVFFVSLRLHRHSYEIHMTPMEILKNNVGLFDCCSHVSRWSLIVDFNSVRCRNSEGVWTVVFWNKSRLCTRYNRQKKQARDPRKVHELFFHFHSTYSYDIIFRSL